MGKRRIRCLRRLGFDAITGYDPRPDRQLEASSAYGIPTTGDWAEAANLPVDAWVVSTPPDTHVSYGLHAVERGIPFFTEANVTDPRTPELMARLEATGGVGAPSCTLRYFPGPRRLKSLIASGAVGRPLAFTYQSGQYLPDWHPWESYKDFYVSKRSTGACREIVPFELCWLTDALGPVETVSCLKGKVSDLDADIDDVYQILMRFSHSNVLGHLMVDVVARPAVRLFRLNGTEGSLEWDHGRGMIRVFTASSGLWEETELPRGSVENGYLHAEEPYVEEMADFVAAARCERPWPYSYTEDQRILDLLVAAEDSDRKGRHL